MGTATVVMTRIYIECFGETTRRRLPARVNPAAGNRRRPLPCLHHADVAGPNTSRSVSRQCLVLLPGGVLTWRR
jgi:hypothetical protein